MKHHTTPHPKTAQTSPPIAAEIDTAQLLEQLAERQDAYLRLAADFANFKRRTAEESGRRADAKKEAFIRELLPIIDNLERALSTGSSGSSGSLAELRNVVEMTQKQLHQLLDQHGIKVENPVGQLFNPHHQEAVAIRHDSSQPDQTVLEVIQPGYHCGALVLRPAKVIVNNLVPAQ